jgi:DNA-binding MarR family transcriptional regulator
MSNSTDARARDRRRVVWIADDDVATARRLLELLEDAPGPDGRDPGDRRLAVDRARSTLSLRKRRVELLGELFASEPPFALLIALYANESRYPEMSLGDLNELASVTPTTALRWLDDLVASGWIERRRLPRRKTRLSLTTKARTGLDKLLSWPE